MSKEGMEKPEIDIGFGYAFDLLPYSGLETIEDLLQFAGEFPKLNDEIQQLIEHDALNQYRLGEDNEDKYLNATQLMHKYGHDAEIHHVTTEDEYKLTMYRIPGEGEPVFIMHGLLMSAVDWLTVGPNKALPYIMAEQGYDVWMGNARGSSVDSRGHVYLSAEDDVARYWDFSWDEIGRYDLPAMIDYVLQKTKRAAVKYVGHSQGTTSFFVMCSERPEYNEKISIMVALSPIVYMSHMESPLWLQVAVMPAAATPWQTVSAHGLNLDEGLATSVGKFRMRFPRAKRIKSVSVTSHHCVIKMMTICLILP
ncbi:lipase 1-like [Pectinophora gossypiella]|uniref:lipase 1-like n=1 Tax=Pectinophora gossypiella TaxID=13191 RepID=UPI00214DF3B1|nr:lipase 1-like [Pectinophora gossypiella]